MRPKYSRGSAIQLKKPLMSSIAVQPLRTYHTKRTCRTQRTYIGPLMPPSFRTRQKCTAINTAMPSGNPTQCST